MPGTVDGLFGIMVALEHGSPVFALIRNTAHVDTHMSELHIRLAVALRCGRPVVVGDEFIASSWDWVCPNTTRSAVAAVSNIMAWVCPH